MITVHLTEYGANPGPHGGTGNYPHKKYFEFNKDNVGLFKIIPQNLLNSWYVSHVEKFTRLLSLNERDELENYLGTGNRVINHTLRHDSSAQKEKIKTRILLLDNATSKGILQQDLIVFRAFKKLSVNVGTIFQDKGFVSTTFDKKVVRFFMQRYGAKTVIMRIMLPKGTRGAFVKSPESEFILPRNTKFKVLQTRPNTILEVVR